MDTRTATSKRLQLNGIEFDFDNGVLRRQDGGEVALRPQSMEVLRYLADRSGKVIGKDELLDAIWPNVAVTENSLTQCVSEIRKAISDEQQTVLKTVARRGYRLVLPAETAVAAGLGTSLQEHGRRSSSRTTTGAFVAALVACALVLAAMLFRSPSSTPQAPISVAVLPFQDYSVAEDHAYLADGMTDSLTTELSRVPDLFVVSRDASRAYRNSASPPSEIALALGVRYLLRGSVQRAGQDLRVTGELVEASSNEQIWADRFDGNFADVFELQDQVVTGIVDALQVRLVPGKANLAVSGDTDSAEAFQAYRRAIEARRNGTPEGTVDALALLRQALVLDPEFGAAWVEMAWLYWDADEARLAALGIDGTESAKRREESLARASTNPSPGYYQLAADLLTREHRSAEAVTLLEKAVPLDPSDAWTYEGLAQTLSFDGRPGEAESYLQAALKVDPGWTDWRRYLAALSAFGQERYRDAIAYVNEMDFDSPDPWSKFYAAYILAASYAHLGDESGAREAVERLRRVATFAHEGEPDLLNVQRYFVYRNPADAARLVEGLRKAGLAESPGLAPLLGTRLSGKDISDNLFGKKLVGRQVWPIEQHLRLEIGPNGASRLTLGAEVVEGHVWVQGDVLCTAYPIDLVDCGILTANAPVTPGGYEYSLNKRFATYSFSIAP